MFVHVDSADVVRLVLQFLKENGLNESFRVLQNESGVDFNAVNDIPRLVKNISLGKWDIVLQTIENLSLSSENLIDLYEQIIIELAEGGDSEAALAILEKSPSIEILVKEFGSRISTLKKIISQNPVRTIQYYNSQKEKQERREEIASKIEGEVYSVKSARLITLLNQSLKWQQHCGLLPKGTKLDLLRDGVAEERSVRESVVAKLDCEIKFDDKETFAESLKFSPDGQFLVSGSKDGFVEIWDFDTAQLRLDVKYQAEDEFMIHSCAVLSLAFSIDSALLAVGGQDGAIKIFQIEDGECFAMLKEAHSAGVMSLEFSKSKNQILTASLDFTAKIHSINNKCILKSFTGHKSFVNKATFAKEETRVITASSDGTVRVWDARTGGCLEEFSPHKNLESAVIDVAAMPSQPGLFLACSKSDRLDLLSLSGGSVRSFALPPGKENEANCIVAFCLSSQGKFVYCLDERGILFCFNFESAKLLSAVKAHEKGPLGIVHHPHKNIVASFSTDSSIRIWRAKR